MNNNNNIQFLWSWFQTADVQVTNPYNAYLYPRDCADLYNGGKQASGVYTVYTFAVGRPVPFKVWCDMETDRGGWMVSKRVKTF